MGGVFLKIIFVFISVNKIRADEYEINKCIAWN